MCNLWAGSGSRLLVLGLKRKDQRCQFGLPFHGTIGFGSVSWTPDGCRFRFGWLLVLGLEA